MLRHRCVIPNIKTKQLQAGIKTRISREKLSKKFWLYTSLNCAEFFKYFHDFDYTLLNGQIN